MVFLFLFHSMNADRVPGEGALPYKEDGVLFVPFRGYKPILVPLRVFNHKRFTLAVGFRVLSQRQKFIIGDNVLF